LPEDRYEEWAESRRQELRRTYLALLVKLARIYEERGDHGSAAEALRKAIAEEPAYEEAQANLMRVYALLGDKAEALRQYELLVETLSRKLGTEPSAASRALREEIVTGTFPSQDARRPDHPSQESVDPLRHNLPMPRTSFVGREREMREVKLAAARVGTLSVEQISERLQDSLGLLTTGGRMTVLRQRTLKGALDWSYDLLSEPERVLFRRLSVFAGGWTFEASETVASGASVEEYNVLDLLSGLVNKSLVVANTTSEGEVRYRMLEPIRQYAREKLEESGEFEVLQRRHATFFLALAEESEPAFRGPAEGWWLDRLEAEHDNLRAALSWMLAQGAAAMLHEATAVCWTPKERLLHEPLLSAARSRLDAAIWETAFAEGKSMRMEQAIEWASPGKTDTLK
jgi:hypothetical protein